MLVFFNIIKIYEIYILTKHILNKCLNDTIWFRNTEDLGTLQWNVILLHLNLVIMCQHYATSALI
jgi:hypothetical protein